MAWDEVTGSHELVLGDRYRLTLWVRLPDTTEMRKRVMDGVWGMDKLWHKLPIKLRDMLGGLEIINVEVGMADSQSANGRLNPWPLRITFKKVGGNTPFLAIAAAIAALIIIAVGAFVIVAKTFEHERKGLNDAFPWALVALAGVGLIVTRR